MCISISVCTCSEGKRLSSRAGKLKCILAYFQKAAENKADLAGMITIRRQVCVFVCVGWVLRLRSTNWIPTDLKVCILVYITNIYFINTVYLDSTLVSILHVHVQVIEREDQLTLSDWTASQKPLCNLTVDETHTIESSGSHTLQVIVHVFPWPPYPPVLGHTLGSLSFGCFRLSRILCGLCGVLWFALALGNAVHYLDWVHALVAVLVPTLTSTARYEQMFID